MTQHNSAKGKKRRKKPEKLEFVQDFIPIKDLRHGIIETTDGRYIKILEIEPINFMLRSDDEQFSIISTFASWLKISPMKLQFKSITRRADSDKHVAMVREELEAEPSEECKHLGEDYINLIKDVGSREALTRRFFLIFQYEELRRNETDDFSQIFSMIQTAEQNARAYFMQCGNNILQPEDPDEATAEILYMFFNRRSCIDEPFTSRVERVVLDTMAAKNKVIGIDEVPHIRFAHFIAPRGIDLKHQNYVIMDGLYYTFLYIKGDGYPSRVRAGWMSALINAGEGVDIDVHLRRENRSKTIDKVAQRIRLNRTKIKSMQDTSTDYEELANSIQAGYYIKHGIANYNEDLFYMSVFVTVFATPRIFLPRIASISGCIFSEISSHDNLKAFTSFIDFHLLRFSRAGFCDVEQALTGPANNGNQELLDAVVKNSASHMKSHRLKLLVVRSYLIIEYFGKCLCFRRVVHNIKKTSASVIIG